jgi:hypothetical protein
LSSFSNRHNRRLCSDVVHELKQVLNLLYADDRANAERLYQDASAVRHPRFRRFRGGGWDAADELFDVCFKALYGPCSCWYCSFTPDQKKRVADEVIRKVAALGQEYLDEKNNHTGAYAEVVFGIRFGLFINQEPGHDGGKDFSLPCPSAETGELTIDVKGTTYGKYRDENRIACSFPFQANWKWRGDHVYVLLQVIDKKHVFYRGFAFGDDKPAIVESPLNGAKRRWKAAAPVRTLEELEALLVNPKPHVGRKVVSTFVPHVVVVPPNRPANEN